MKKNESKKPSSTAGNPPKKDNENKEIKKKGKRDEAADGRQAYFDDIVKSIVPVQVRKIKKSPAELEARSILSKEYTRFKMYEEHQIMKRLDTVKKCRDNTLTELKLLDENLYKEAIEPDITLWPINFIPIMETPPIKGYISSAEN